MNTKRQMILHEIKQEFTTIEDIPNIYGTTYNADPIISENNELQYKNFHVAKRNRAGFEYLVRQYSPEYNPKTKTGFYVVYYKIL